MGHGFSVVSKNFLPYLRSQRFLLNKNVFSFKSLIVLGFTLRLTVHFRGTLYVVRAVDRTAFFAWGHPVDPAPFAEKTTLFPLSSRHVC